MDSLGGVGGGGGVGCIHAFVGEAAAEVRILGNLCGQSVCVASSQSLCCVERRGLGVAEGEKDITGTFETHPVQS